MYGFYSGGNLTIFHNRLNLVGYFLSNLIKKFLALLFFHREVILNLLVCNRVKVAYSQILKFLLDCSDTETVSNRSVNLKGFERFFSLFMRRHMLECTHIVQSVRKFNNNYTDILVHGNKHFAYIFSLNFLTGGKRNLSQLCYAVNQQCHIVAEIFADIFQVIFCILYHIVQKCADNTLVVHAVVQQYFCYSYRVHDIRLT